MACDFHDPVLEKPLLELLSPRPGGTYVDANLGGGSHSLKILERLEGRGRVVGIDLDPEALQAARHRLQGHGNFEPVHGNFADLSEILDRLGLEAVDGVIFDLGVSSHQLDRPERGFSFRGSGPLDMRFDPAQRVTAEHLVNTLPEPELERIIREYGEERWAGPIARKIVQQRQHGRIATTHDLAEVVARAVPRKFHPPRIHVATRTFQGLRIAVNAELDNLSRGLAAAVERLAPGGRVCCISYHSLEDRMVKRFFLQQAGAVRPAGLPRGMPPPESRPVVEILTRHPIIPSEEEIAVNPRARSAHLRGAQKL